MNTQDVYETIIDTLTDLYNGLEGVYDAEYGDLWDADKYREYCEAVGAETCEDPIQEMLISLNFIMERIPEPPEAGKDETQDLPQMIVAVYPVVAPAVSEIIPIDAIIDDSQYLGNHYRPAGQYRVMKCINVLRREDKPLRLGFNINPLPGKPWLQYYPIDDCVLINSEQERAA